MRPLQLLGRGLVLLALVTACGGGSDAPPSPTPASAEPAVDGPAEPTQPEPTQAEPTQAEPTQAEPTQAEPTQAEPGPGALRVIAVREGAVDLFAHHGAPVLSLEGEPVAYVQGHFTPEPGGSLGMPPGYDPMSDVGFTRAIGSDPQATRPTWVTTENHYSRSGPVYSVYQRQGDRWKAIERRKGPLVAHYAAYVEREGALLALQQWSLHPSQESYADDDESPGAMAKHAALMRTVERARPSWVHLSGPPVSVPELPAKTALRSAIGLADGTIYGVTPRSEGSPSRLLQWPPGVTKAETVPLPELERASELGLSSSGGWVLVHGGLASESGETSQEAYLAVGHEGTWERIPVQLPGRSDDMDLFLLAAARAPDGELWIAVGLRELQMAEAKPVWRKPIGGAWEPVPLPRLTNDAFGSSTGWIFENEYGINGWAELDRGPIDHSTVRAVGLSWAAGALWVSLAYDGDSAVRGVRSAVLSTDPKAPAGDVLPPVWKTELERANRMSARGTPGGKECESFSVVLGPAGLATERPDLAETIAALEIEGLDDPLGDIYTGELEGKSVLVLRAIASSPALAAAVQKATAAVTGTKVTLDCRVPMLETMVRTP